VVIYALIFVDCFHHENLFQFLFLSNKFLEKEIR
ncbi:uncharacterized protein METZ01_LOCUS170719, partial [marine metagenome]